MWDLLCLFGKTFSSNNVLRNGKCMDSCTAISGLVFFIWPTWWWMKPKSELSVKARRRQDSPPIYSQLSSWQFKFHDQCYFREINSDKSRVFFLQICLISSVNLPLSNIFSVVVVLVWPWRTAGKPLLVSKILAFNIQQWETLSAEKYCMDEPYLTNRKVHPPLKFAANVGVVSPAESARTVHRPPSDHP